MQASARCIQIPGHVNDHEPERYSGPHDQRQRLARPGSRGVGCNHGHNYVPRRAGPCPRSRQLRVQAISGRGRGDDLKSCINLLSINIFETKYCDLLS